MELIASGGIEEVAQNFPPNIRNTVRWETSCKTVVAQSCLKIHLLWQAGSPISCKGMDFPAVAWQQ